MTRVRYENGKRVIERWDGVFRALSAEPRRQLVVALADVPRNRPVSLPESAANPNVPGDPSLLEAELRHHHLPLLADSDFIEWEAEPFAAVRGPRFDEVAVVFEALYGAATEVPDALVVGCQRLEWERQAGSE